MRCRVLCTSKSYEEGRSEMAALRAGLERREEGICEWTNRFGVGFGLGLGLGLGFVWFVEMVRAELEVEVETSSCSCFAIFSFPSLLVNFLGFKV